MPIKNIVTQQPTGLVGVQPWFIYIDTSDTLATVTTAGYLNPSKSEGFTYSAEQMVLIYTTDFGVQLCQVSINASTQVITLVQYSASLSSLIVSGNIQSLNGNILSGNNNGVGITHAGNFQSFPSTSNGANDKLVLAATTSGGNFTTTITNAAQAASRTYTIPDGGASSNFLLTNSGGTQTIATGNLTLTAGNFQVTAGTIVGGTTITAGINNSSAGSFVAIPAGNNQGSLQIVPVANAGGFASVISNTAIGQASTYSLPDPANAAARILVGATATPFTANHSLVASGTGGLIADAGYQMKVVAQAAVAGGAAAQTVNDAFCTSASMVVCTWNDTTNAVSIQKAVAGNGSFVVTSSGDPGASHLNYIITKV